MEFKTFLTEQAQFVEQKIQEYKGKNLKIVVSSSFQTHSIPLLHLISRIDRHIPVAFLNTGFHFPETLEYRDRVAEMLDLKLVNLWAPIEMLGQRDASNKFLFASDPDYCCYLNKVLPMEMLMKDYNVWISGVRQDQNNNRRQFQFEVEGPHQTLRFHPMLQWTTRMIWEYRRHFDLPEHPLDQYGYFSIGCAPCTRNAKEADGRQGRWAGMKKTECGLHTDLIKHSSSH